MHNFRKSLGKQEILGDLYMFLSKSGTPSLQHSSKIDVDLLVGIVIVGCLLAAK